MQQFINTPNERRAKLDCVGEVRHAPLGIASTPARAAWPRKSPSRAVVSRALIRGRRTSPHDRSSNYASAMIVPRSDDDVTVRVFIEYANALDDCAEFTRSEEFSDEGTLMDVLELTPRNERSIGVVLAVFTDGDNVERVISLGTVPSSGEDAVDATTVSYFVEAAVEGRANLLEGRGRDAIEIIDPRGNRLVSRNYDLIGLLPNPGWRNKAGSTSYEPYRT